MAGEGVFPKCDGDVYYAEDVNFVYDTSVREILNTAMQTTQLSYEASVTDISRDFITVDTFSDNTGYNDTVCSTDTTSQFDSGNCWYCINSTGGTCYFPVTCVCVHCWYTDRGTASSDSCCCVFACGCASGWGCRGGADICLDQTATICLDCYDQWSFNVCYCGCATNQGGSASSATSKSCLVLTGYCCTFCCVWTCNDDGTCTYAGLDCYTFNKICNGCYCVCCNGTPIDDWACGEIDYCIVAIGETYSSGTCGSGQACSYACTKLTCMTVNCYSNSIIATNLQCYDNCVEGIYYTDDANCFSGSCIRVDVFDCDGTKIGCDLCPDNYEELSTKTNCCVYYQIKQCGLSCIKKYAISVDTITS